MSQAPADAAEPPAATAGVAEVLVPVGLDTAYSYRVPATVPLAVGDLVSVPFGPRETVGVVWSLEPAEGGRGANLKPVTDRLDLPGLRQPLREFIDWVA